MITLSPLALVSVNALTVLFFILLINRYFELDSKKSNQQTTVSPEKESKSEESRVYFISVILKKEAMSKEDERIFKHLLPLSHRTISDSNLNFLKTYVDSFCVEELQIQPVTFQITRSWNSYTHFVTVGDFAELTLKRIKSELL